MFVIPVVSKDIDYGVRQYDFAPWVDHYSKRFDLSKPFDFNGFSIATDGRKLIRVPVMQSSELDGSRKTPDASHLPWDGFDDGGWKPFSKQRIKPKNTGTYCEQCCGIGWIGKTEWKEFDVRTTPEPYRKRYEHDCWIDSECFNQDEFSKYLERHGWKTTDWIGEKMCDQCVGSGWNVEGCEYQIDGQRFDSGFISAIERLGSFETRLEDYGIKQYGEPETVKLLLFRGDGFDGMVMPRNDR